QEIIGFLNLDSIQPNAFVTVDPAQLMVFANQVGVAIEKIRLIESEKAQRELSDTLRAISDVLTRPMSLEELLKAFLEQVAHVIPYDAAAIWYIDEEKAADHFSYGVGYEKFGVQDIMPTLQHTAKNSHLMQRLMSTGKALVVPEIEGNDPEWQDPRFSWIKSWASAPIFIQGQYFGKLVLDSTQKGLYKPSYIPLLETLTRQLSIALENVNLLETLEQRVAKRTQELNRERQQLQTILSSMDEGVIYLETTPQTPNLTVRYVNESLRTLLGISSDQFIGHSLSIILSRIKSEKIVQHINSLLESVYQETKPTQLVWRDEFVMQLVNGQEVDFAATLTVVKTEVEHDFMWALMVLRDISQEKALNAQRERFVANASHELRNPLSNLFTRMYLLEKQPDRQEEHIAVMKRTVERLNALAEDLLDIARFNTHSHLQFQYIQFDLRELIHDIIEQQRSNAEIKGVTIIEHLPEQPVQVWADRKRIEQVITNLIFNAISYTKEKTTVEVQLEEQQEYILLFVQDEGIGIAPEFHEQIFLPFFRASEGKVSGTGLGLAIAKEIIERHEGKIWVESDLNQGSRFIVQLPKRLPQHFN
ncbi:MAG: hypothetical protein CUN55_10295, partial [Phototrophicales bacterium]